MRSLATPDPPRRSTSDRNLATSHVRRSRQHGQSRTQHLSPDLLTRFSASSQHGVKRSRIPPVPDSEEVARKKREKELKRIEEYRTLLKDVQDRVRGRSIYVMRLLRSTQWMSTDESIALSAGLMLTRSRLRYTGCITRLLGRSARSDDPLAVAQSRVSDRVGHPAADSARWTAQRRVCCVATHNLSKLTLID